MKIFCPVLSTVPLRTSLIPILSKAVVIWLSGAFTAFVLFLDMAIESVRIVWPFGIVNQYVLSKNACLSPLAFPLLISISQ